MQVCSSGHARVMKNGNNALRGSDRGGFNVWFMFGSEFREWIQLLNLGLRLSEMLKATDKPMVFQARALLFALKLEVKPSKAGHTSD